MLKNNRIILFSDVLRSILKHFIRVCIVTAVLTVLLSAYFYIQDKRKTAAQANLDAEASHYDLAAFTGDELIQAQNAIDARSVLDDTQKYYDNSYIQKVDPFAVHQTTLYYKVKMDSSRLPENLVGQEGTLEAALRTEYYYYVARGDLGTDVAEVLGIEPQYITELISIENDGNTAFSVICRASDLIPEFADTVCSVLAEHGKELEPSFYAHSLILNDKFETVVRIDDYYNRQRNSTSEINTCTNNLNGLLNKLNMQQVAYYNAETGSDFWFIDQETGKPAERYESLGRSGLIKRAIISLIIAAAFACVFELFLYMYSPRIIAESDYSASLGIDVIGNSGSEESGDLAIVKLRSMCERNKIERLVITSTEPSLLKNGYVSKIKEALENTEIVILNDPVNASVQLQDLLSTGNAVLLEKIGKSKYSKVREISETCEKNGVKLLGVIDCGKSR